MTDNVSYQRIGKFRSWYKEAICTNFHRDHWEYYYDPPIRILRCLRCRLVICVDSQDNPCRERH